MMDIARPALQASLLRTKLFIPPLRSQLVARARLTQRLASASDDGDKDPARFVTYVCAAMNNARAGSGDEVN